MDKAQAETLAREIALRAPWLQAVHVFEIGAFSYVRAYDPMQTLQIDFARPSDLPTYLTALDRYVSAHAERHD